MAITLHIRYLRHTARCIMRFFLLLTVLVVGFAGSPSFAQNDAYARFQYGNKTCGQFLQSIDEYKRYGKAKSDPDGVTTPVYAGFASFMWGFLTGSDYFDRQHDSVGIKSEVHANSLFLENFCRSHPLDTFQIALEYLRAELIKKGL